MRTEPLKLQQLSEFYSFLFNSIKDTLSEQLSHKTVTWSVFSSISYLEDVAELLFSTLFLYLGDEDGASYPI